MWGNSMLQIIRTIKNQPGPHLLPHMILMELLLISAAKRMNIVTLKMPAMISTHR